MSGRCRMEGLQEGFAWRVWISVSSTRGLGAGATRLSETHNSQRDPRASGRWAASSGVPCSRQRFPGSVSPRLAAAGCCWRVGVPAALLEPCQQAWLCANSPGCGTKRSRHRRVSPPASPV